MARRLSLQQFPELQYVQTCGVCHVRLCPAAGRDYCLLALCVFSSMKYDAVHSGLQAKISTSIRAFFTRKGHRRPEQHSESDRSHRQDWNTGRSRFVNPQSEASCGNLVSLWLQPELSCSRFSSSLSETDGPADAPWRRATMPSRLFGQYDSAPWWDVRRLAV
jgi:hypothetical protein